MGYITNGDVVKFGGSERLKGLLKLLPDKTEIDMLRSFDGDMEKLGTAEKFLLLLTSLTK